MKHTVNVDAFVQGIKGIKALTFGGANFVNESLAQIKKSGLTLRKTAMILESAANSKDAAVRAFAKSQKAAMGADGFGFKASLVMEDLMSDGSANMQKAASAIEDAVDVASTDEPIIRAIAVDGALDNYDMYPEVKSLIKQAKDIYYAANPEHIIATGDCQHVLAIIEDNIMGLPVVGKWFTVSDGNLLYATASEPSAESVALMDAMSLVQYCPKTEAFFADTIVGHVRIVGQDAIELDSQVMTALEFAEKVKTYMQLNQVSMQVAGEFETAEAICNAVIAVAQQFTKLAVLDNSVKLQSAPIIVYAVDGNHFNMLDTQSGIITVYGGIVALIAALQSISVSAPEIECIKSMWREHYDTAMKAAIRASAQVDAYQTVLNNVESDIAAVQVTMQSMDPTSEGYAAHQQILDSYLKQKEQLQSRIAELLPKE